MTENQLSAALFGAVAVIAVAATALGYTVARIDTALGNLGDAPLVPDSTSIELAPGVQVFVDAETGCQYLQSRNGITPRIHSDGVPYCDDREETQTDYSEGEDQVLPEATNYPTPYLPQAQAPTLDPLDADFAKLKAITRSPRWRF